jgi:predicted peptidase
VDKHRVYVGGLSMGGMGTFELLRRKPNVFAAAFAICGGDNTFNAKLYAKKVPLWIFHGAKDDVVPVEHSLVMAEAIKAAGGNPKLTIYPNDSHNSWNDAFAEPDLIPWLFSHTK